MPAWECGACTWFNDERSIGCLMCQNKRPRHLSPTAGRSRPADNIIFNVPEKKTSSQTQQQNDDKKKESTPKEDNQSIQKVSTRVELSECTTKNETKRASEWNAFASLEHNYETSDSSDDQEGESGSESVSDSDDSDDNADSENCNEDIEDGYNQRDVKVGANWNAFKSLQETLGDNNGSSSSDSKESDCILIDEEEEQKLVSTKTSSKNKPKTEFVDLVDTDDDEVEQEVIDDTKSPKRGKSRKRNRSSYQIEMALLDDGSDSSCLSEVESSRPLRQIRSIPPWQRSARKDSNSSSILQSDSVLPCGSFPCLNSRNDVAGCPIETTMSSTTRERKTFSTKSLTKAGSKSRKRSNSNNAAPVTKKRRTRKYRRTSSKRGGRGGRGRAAASSSSSSRSNNAWSARERGIRQPIRGNNGSGSYMNITKQEPMLRNIGGASIQF